MDVAPKEVISMDVALKKVRTVNFTEKIKKKKS